MKLSTLTSATLTFATLSAAFVLMPHVSSVKAQDDAITGGKKAVSDKLNIASNIQGQERDVIAASMSSLAPEDRENVIMIDGDGNAHANKTWLLNQGSVGLPKGDNVYEDGTGQQFSMPEQTEKPSLSTPQSTADVDSINPKTSQPGLLNPHVYTPTPYPNSGPYRRVWSSIPSLVGPSGNLIPSDTGIGHSYEDATVYLPSRYTPRKHPGVFERVSAATTAVGGTNDTAAIYMGGWSASYNNGTAIIPYDSVDAGFTHDNGSNTSTTHTVQPVRDSWVMTVYSHSGVGPPQVQKPDGVAFAFRLLADQTVPFKFYISHDSSGGQTYFNLVATAHGQSYDINPATHHYDDLGTHTWTISVLIVEPQADAWHVDGTGVVLKRMTTIGQNGHNDPSTCSYVRNVKWTNCRIGVSGQAPNSYVTKWDYTHTGGTENYLANKVHVTDLKPDPSAPGQLDYTHETDRIQLCGR